MRNVRWSASFGKRTKTDFIIGLKGETAGWMLCRLCCYLGGGGAWYGVSLT